jgi:hypothetical protein
MVEVAGRPAGDGAMDYDISRPGSRTASLDLLNREHLAAPLRIVPGLGHVVEDFLNRSIYPDFSLDPHDQILRQCTAAATIYRAGGPLLGVRSRSAASFS